MANIQLKIEISTSWYGFLRLTRVETCATECSAKTKIIISHEHFRFNNLCRMAIKRNHLILCKLRRFVSDNAANNPICKPIKAHLKWTADLRGHAATWELNASEKKSGINNFFFQVFFATTQVALCLGFPFVMFCCHLSNLGSSQYFGDFLSSFQKQRRRKKKEKTGCLIRLWQILLKVRILHRKGHSKIQSLILTLNST